MSELVIIIFLTALSIWDIRERKVPVVFLGLAVCAALTYRTVMLSNNGNFVSALLGILPGTVIIAAACITGKIGLADGIVLSVLGLVTDYRCVVMIISISMIMIAVVSLVLLAMRRINKNSELPYIPFIEAAYIICMFI
jgi:prepilin signal peptidase PulO-like enzyme (type II secretory pathway)